MTAEIVDRSSGGGLMIFLCLLCLLTPVPGSTAPETVGCITVTGYQHPERNGNYYETETIVNGLPVYQNANELFQFICNTEVGMGFDLCPTNGETCTGKTGRLGYVDKDEDVLAPREGVIYNWGLDAGNLTWEGPTCPAVTVSQTTSYLDPNDTYTTVTTITPTTASPTSVTHLSPTSSPSQPQSVSENRAQFMISIGFNFTSNATRSATEKTIVKITNTIVGESIANANMSDCYESKSVSVEFETNASVMVNSTLQLCNQENAELLRAYYVDELEYDILTPYMQSSTFTVIAESTTVLVYDVINVREAEVRNPATTVATIPTKTADQHSNGFSIDALSTTTVIIASACGAVLVIFLVLCCVAIVCVRQHVQGPRFQPELSFPRSRSRHESVKSISVQQMAVAVAVAGVTFGENADEMLERTEADVRRAEEVRQWLLNKVPSLPPKYAELLIENGFDNMDMMMAIEQESDLIEIGINSKAHRMLILSAVGPTW